MAYARMTTVLATKVAKELVESKSQALLEGKGSTDIMTLLSKPALPMVLFYLLTFFLEVKANASEDQKRRLNEEELLSQMRYVNYIVITGCDLKHPQDNHSGRPRDNHKHPQLDSF